MRKDKASIGVHRDARNILACGGKIRDELVPFLRGLVGIGQSQQIAGMICQQHRRAVETFHNFPALRRDGDILAGKATRSRCPQRDNQIGPNKIYFALQQPAAMVDFADIGPFMNPPLPHWLELEMLHGVGVVDDGLLVRGNAWGGEAASFNALGAKFAPFAPSRPSREAKYPLLAGQSHF